MTSFRFREARRRPSSGFTIAELLVSSVVLGLLLAVTFSIYRMGAAAWQKSDAKSELLQIAQVVTAKVNREVEGSTFRSLEVAGDGSGAAFLTARDENGVFQYDPVKLTPRWQQYVVLYFVPAQKTLYRREVSVAGLPQQDAAMPINSLGAGALPTYFRLGQPIGRGMDECRFSVGGDEQLILELSASKLRYGSPTPEKQSIRVVTAFRNR